MPPVVKAAQDSIFEEVLIIQQLSEVASKNPYYRFNYAWTRQMQDVVGAEYPYSSDQTFASMLTQDSASQSCFAAI